MAVVTTDHAVPHESQLPLNKGETVNLFVRERDGTRSGTERKAVLMLHGRSVPVLPGFDLGTDKYNWMLFLADAGFDVFAMDLQGYGRSPRPSVMNEPCNANPKHQKLLFGGNPLPGQSTCPATYANQLGDSRSDWSEVHTVVEFIKDRHNCRRSPCWAGPRRRRCSARTPSSIRRTCRACSCWHRSSRRKASPP